jgi:hypothetical protein
MERSDTGPVVAEIADTARARRLSVRAGHYFVRGRTNDRLLEGEIDAPGGSSTDVSDDRLHAVEYARLVRKGEGGRTFVHGPEAAYFFQTPLKNATDLCEGGFAGYAAHFEHASVGARLAACRSGFAAAGFRAFSDQLGGELRAAHTWDLPVVSVDLGLALGGWILRQTFDTAGVAPSTVTPAGSLALDLGAHVDLVRGFALFSDSALLSYVYAQREEITGSTSLGPYFAFRQAFGVSKIW